VGEGVNYRTVKPENGFRDIPAGHFETFEKKIYPIWAQKMVGLVEDYAFYPRGRILYREKDKRFVIYLDRCLLTKKDKKAILHVFALPSAIWRRDEQYQCAGCNPQLKEDAEVYEFLKN
jgi:hypothetical protein